MSKTFIFPENTFHPRKWCFCDDFSSGKNDFVWNLLYIGIMFGHQTKECKSFQPRRCLYCNRCCIKFHFKLCLLLAQTWKSCFLIYNQFEWEKKWFAYVPHCRQSSENATWHQKNIFQLTVHYEKPETNESLRWRNSNSHQTKCKWNFFDTWLESLPKVLQILRIGI